MIRDFYICDLKKEKKRKGINKNEKKKKNQQFILMISVFLYL